MAPGPLRWDEARTNELRTQGQESWPTALPGGMILKSYTW